MTSFENATSTSKSGSQLAQAVDQRQALYETVPDQDHWRPSLSHHPCRQSRQDTADSFKPFIAQAEYPKVTEVNGKVVVASSLRL